jgi:hypothetical protein
MSKSFWIAPPEHGRAEDYVELWLEKGDINPPPSKGRRRTKGEDTQPFMIVGFDTEFKTPGYAVTKDDIQNDKAKSLILSYQFYAKCSDGRVWSGICCPEHDERISLDDFMLFVLGSGARIEGHKALPAKIYLVGHFTRADMPSFSNFGSITKLISAVRNTFISMNNAWKCSLPVMGAENIQVQLFLRDTMLLTPQASRRLKDIGDLVGVKKVELSPDRKTYREMIGNMDVVRRDQWSLFREYALTDAEICVRYIEEVMDQYKEVTGKTKVPVTLTGIGIDLLEKKWIEMKYDRLSVLGKEIVEEKVFDKKRGYYRTVKSEKDVRLKHYYEALATDCYHGGRNEQYWFGPCFVDHWSDFDLSSAYPTAMSLIGFPDWNDLRVSTEVDDYGPTVLGYAVVEFEFPKETRYPTIPVRTGNGLVFPLKGVSECPAPEIYLAKRLGAKLKITHGVIVASDPTRPVFAEFIKECIEKRNKAGKKTLRGLFWKEITNSSYGKTAQGLRERRVYDLRNNKTEPLEPSRITNAYFAAFITSFVRAVLGEILNSLPRDKIAFSCTTDGFLTNINRKQAFKCTQGEFSWIYRKQRLLLSKQSSVLERKHYVKQPLGWRTRGQATLELGSPKGKDNEHIVLAKGGIWTKPELEGIEEQNDAIVDLFLNRTPGTIIHIEGKTGLRDMVEQGADYVDKLISKRLNMEYDWKRRPIGCRQSKALGHVVFSTDPWSSVEDFILMRSVFDDFQANEPRCIKSYEDMVALSTYTETKTVAAAHSLKNLHKVDGDLDRLRQMLCVVHNIKGFYISGVRLTGSAFSQILNSCGVRCNIGNIDNGRYQKYVPHQVPPTERVLLAIIKLSALFPEFNFEELLVESTKYESMIRLLENVDCPFVARVG